MTLALAAAGGALFSLLSVPAGWLSGAALAVTALQLSAHRAAMPPALRDTAFLVLGVSMGSGITPEAAAGVLHWPLSIAALLLTIPVIVGSAGWFLVRMMGWDAREAFLAAAPGALPYVVAVAESANLDVPRVAVAQSIRLVLMVALLPSLIVASGVAGAAPPPQLHEADLATILGLIGISVAASFPLAWLKIPAPLLMGGLLTSAALHGSGFVATQLPLVVTVPALIVVGANVGCRFAGADVGLLRRVAIASLLAFLIMLVLSFLAAILVATALGMPLAQTVVAYAPGGIDSSIVIAYALGLDPAFVAAHQLSRFLAIALLLPIVFKSLAGRAPDGAVDRKGD
jgi:hypothetical protein